MKKSLLFLTPMLLLAGGTVTTASAQTVYYNNSNAVVVDADSDRDGIPDSYDAVDDRFDMNGSLTRYDQYGNRLDSVVLDRNCDGVMDRYERNSQPDLLDADCDGIPNRLDYDHSRVTTVQYYAPAYVAPTGYHYVRYEAGGYLPLNYVGPAYVVDYQMYGLTPPPYGYTWNRVGNDVYLVSMSDGLIAEVVYNLFH